MAEKIKLLIVDDMLSIRMVLEKIFSNTPDIQVVGSASTPLEAREILKNTKVDVITLDVEMPEMDGYTLTKSIKAHPEMQSLTVVLHSSLSGIFNETMVKKVGADAFLAKYDPEELALCISENLKDRPIADKAA